MKKKHFYLLFAILLLSQLSGFTQSFLPGKLFLKVNSSLGVPKLIVAGGDSSLIIDDDQLQQIFRDQNVKSFVRAFPIADSMKSAKKYGLEKVYVLSCQCDEERLKEDLSNISNNYYSYVEKIPKRFPAYTPDDYHIQDTDSISGPDSALNLIKAEKAWDYTKGDSNILIGIVDENLMNVANWNHEDINGKIVYWDTINGNSEYFHGLFVAGCAAGKTDNGVGKSSIGNKCRLMFSSHSWSAAGFLNLSHHGVKVLNASWGSYEFDSTMQLVINAVTDNGTLVVAAAGNLPHNQTGKFGYYYYPASNDKVLSVTSIDYNDKFVTWDTNIIGRHFNYNDSVDI